MVAVADKLTAKLTPRERESLEAWSAYLYKAGYTTYQCGLALGVSASTVSNSLARGGIKTRTGPGKRSDLDPGVHADAWRTFQPVPGAALAEGRLNQQGLLTMALATWRSKNALSVIASRVADATEQEVKDGISALDAAIRYAQELQRVLREPEFADEVRHDPSYRDDIGHRFG